MILKQKLHLLHGLKLALDAGFISWGTYIALQNEILSTGGDYRRETET